MKQLFLIFTFFLSGLINSSAQESYTLTINFTGMKSDTGSVYVGIHNKEKDFLKKRFKEAVITVTNRKGMAIIKELPKGEYAVSAFHDENENYKMDTNFIGIPKEPIGISNDATGFMGPPKYKDAKFQISKDTTISIKIN